MLRDWVTALTVGEVISAVAFLAGILGGVAILWKKLAPWRAMALDLFGEAARPGVKARPGVMERMSTQDADLAEIKVQVAEIGEQVGRAVFNTQPNHGSSSHDAIMGALRGLQAGQEAQSKRLDVLDKKTDFLRIDDDEDT